MKTIYRNEQGNVKSYFVWKFGLQPDLGLKIFVFQLNHHGMTAVTCPAIWAQSDKKRPELAFGP
jgi:hypothetical protein